jgi:uncharacterized membrane protein
MTMILIGLLLWIAAHFFKRVLPDVRSGMNERMGAGPARGIMSVLILLSVILMIVGFRGHDATVLYTPMDGMRPVNNLLMIISVVLFGMSGSKGRLGTMLRHPMLLGVLVWAVAHLLVNGDMASVVLFGGMGIWAVMQIVLINAQDIWTRPERGPASGDVKLFIISAVVFSVIAGIHIALGYNPFSGSL